MEPRKPKAARLRPAAPAEAAHSVAETLLDAIRHIEDRSGASLLIDATIARNETGRRFSEAFLIESGDLEAVRRAAAEIGFSVRAGRRFLHLYRECDEGEALAAAPGNGM